jgi:hypothetical protein
LVANEVDEVASSSDEDKIKAYNETLQKKIDAIKSACGIH